MYTGLAFVITDKEELIAEAKDALNLELRQERKATGPAHIF